MVNYWLCITNEENWEVLKKRKVWGVSERNKGQIKGVKPGDALVFYVKPKRLAGIFKAISEPFRSDERIFSTTGFTEEETFPHRVKLEPMIIPEELMSFKELIPKLKFITNKERWGAYLRRAILTIPKGDYEILDLSIRSH